MGRSSAETAARTAESLEAGAPEGPAGNSDPISAWLDREIERLESPDAPTLMLMRVVLERRQVRGLDDRAEEANRRLRQGWRAGFEDVETIPLEDLERKLQGRGFALGAVDPGRIDDLLPIAAESDTQWLVRRAATEVKYDSGLRFIKYQGLVLPENQPGEAPNVAAVANSALQSLLGEAPAEDPLRARLRDVERRGRVGVVVTGLTMAPDFATVTVESALWVRLGPDRWRPAVQRPATVRPENVRPDAATPLANDPQVQGAFNLFEGLGLGAISPELKQRGLTVGAATRQALGDAQSALRRDLESLSLMSGRE